MQPLSRASWLSLCGGVALLAAASTVLHAQAPGGLPPGEGRELVAVVCSQCHGLNTIMAVRDGPAGWRQFVNYMIMKGAPVGEGETETIVQYLAASFGPAQQPPPSPASLAALPPGAGKELIEARCVACHDLTRIVASKRQKAEWDGIVANMVARGAYATPEERQTLVAYLTAQFGQ
jgi:mono/diheme cytochrome c family protein